MSPRSYLILELERVQIGKTAVWICAETEIFFLWPELRCSEPSSTVVLSGALDRVCPHPALLAGGCVYHDGLLEGSLI